MYFIVFFLFPTRPILGSPAAWLAFRRGAARHLFIERIANIRIRSAIALCRAAGEFGQGRAFALLRKAAHAGQNSAQQAIAGIVMESLKIGRESLRERGGQYVEISVVAVSIKKK